MTSNGFRTTSKLMALLLTPVQGLSIVTRRGTSMDQTWNLWSLQSVQSKGISCVTSTRISIQNNGGRLGIHKDGMGAHIANGICWRHKGERGDEHFIIRFHTGHKQSHMQGCRPIDGGHSVWRLSIITRSGLKIAGVRGTGVESA